MDEFIVGAGIGVYGHQSPATVRTTLGLGTLALQNANTVAITGGTATLSTLAAVSGITATGGIRIGRALAPTELLQIDCSK